MICYRLRCERGHEFEGWFKNSDGFEDQSCRGLISCPDCSSRNVTQALMAPAVRTSSGNANVASTSQDPVAIPDKIRAALQNMRATIEANCEDVGNNFATEALKISRGEADDRGIYGSATDRERDMLESEGVEFASIPWLPRLDS